MPRRKRRSYYGGGGSLNLPTPVRIAFLTIVALWLLCGGFGSADQELQLVIINIVICLVPISLAAIGIRVFLSHRAKRQEAEKVSADMDRQRAEEFAAEMKARALEEEDRVRALLEAEERRKAQEEAERQHRVTDARGRIERAEQHRRAQEELTRQRLEEEERIRANMRFGNLVSMTPSQFEKAMAILLSRRGFNVTLTGRTGDGGVDLRMHKDGLNFIAQCKRYSDKTVGSPEMRDFFAALVDSGVSHGYFITTSRFTEQARQFAEHKPITLVDMEVLREWVKE